MNKSIERRLDRLTERLLPDRPGRSWQIVIWTPEGPVKGPVLTWRPGQTAETPLIWPSHDCAPESTGASR
jgi:hypothetical protein